MINKTSLPVCIKNKKHVKKRRGRRKERKFERTQGVKGVEGERTGGFFVVRTVCCLVALVQFHCFLVESGSFLARNKSFQSEVLSCLHESFGPFVKTVSFVGALSCGVGFFGHNTASLVLHEVTFGLTGGLHFLSGSSPHLVAASSDGDTTSTTASTDNFASGRSAATSDTFLSHGT